MSLDTQIVPIPLGRGVNTKVDPKILPNDRLAVLENAVLRTGERATKRNGYAPLGQSIVGGGTLTGGDSLLTYRDELLQAKAQALYSLSRGLSAWQSRGFVVPLVASGKSIARNPYAQTCPDAGSVQGVTLYAWEDSRGGVRCSVLDDATGTVLQSDVSLNASGATPKVAAFGGPANVLLAVYRVAGTLRCKVYTPQSNSFGNEITIAADIANADPSPFDVVPANSLNVVVYGTGAAVKVAYLKASGAFAGAGDPYPAAVTLGGSPTKCVTAVWDPVSGYFYVAYGTTTPALKGFVLNANFTTLVADKNLDATATISRNVTGVLDPSTANQVLFFYEFAASNAWNALINTVTFNSAGTVGTPAVLKRSVGLGSKAWVQGGVAYVGAAYSTALNPTNFVLDSSGNIIARLLAAQAGGLTAKLSTLPAVRASGAIWRYPTLTLDRLLGSTTAASGSAPLIAYLTGVWESSLDFSNPQQHYSAQLGEALGIVGGALFSYDGAGCVEWGFHVPPENVTHAEAVGGSLTTNATYGVAVMWEWQDAQGQLHRSNTQVLTIAMGANSKTTLTIPTLRLTAKTGVRGEAWVVVYRTLANGATYYRDTSLTSPLLNDPTVDTVTYVVTQADTAVSGNELLYNNANISTAAGVLPVLGNDPPPACSIIAAGKTRLFVNDSEHPGAIYYTKRRAANVAPSFSQVLTKIIPQDIAKGPERGLGVMDDRLYIFRASSILRMGGDGPDDTGASDSFQMPQIISSDVGCSNPNSIVLTDDGLYFQSAKGICLLGRDESVRYIGAEVEQFNGQTITRALAVPQFAQVRFLTSAGMTLVYDTHWRQWSWYANHQGKDAVLFGGVYTYLRLDGAVWQETPGSTTDAGAYNPMRLRTSWIKTGGIAGFQRLKRLRVLGELQSPHRLTIRVAYNYEKYFTDVFNAKSAQFANSDTFGSGSPFGSDSPFGGSGDGTYVWEVMLRRQKCEAIQVELEDAPVGDATPPGEGLSLTALALVAGIKKGLRKTGVNTRMG